MSQSTPPNSSSENEAATEPAAGADPDAGLEQLIERLAEQFEFGPETVATAAEAFAEVRANAPDLFLTVPSGLATALSETAAAGDGNPTLVHAAIGDWAREAASEPIERMRRDCLAFQSTMSRGVMRLAAGNPERCAAQLGALQRLNFLQLALLATLSARSEEGGVTRTLPTPEYAAFMEVFRSQVEMHRQEGKTLAVVLLQVEKIEQIDRLLGLQKGEAFMLRVTRRMREGVLRKQDQLGRVSRDQLACLLPRIAGEGVAILAANRILGALEAPITLGERSFDPDVSIGIAIYPDHGEDPQALVRNAKLAATAARQTTERVLTYDPAQGESEENKVRHEVRLREALDKNTLGLLFELQLNLENGRLAGLESVLRWRDAELGDVSEEQTMETAEAAGLVREVTSWMFDNALRRCADFVRAGLTSAITVKAPTAVLLQPDFPDFVARSLRTWNIPPKQLVIGIHETGLAGNLEQMAATLERLKKFGLRLGIEGFGTGSLSIADLSRLPLDEMKLGGSLVSGMRDNTEQAKVVRALTRLARDLELRVTAEGVDDAETALALSRLGCERVQGAYVNPPLTADEIIAFERHTGGLARLSLSDL